MTVLQQYYVITHYGNSALFTTNVGGNSSTVTLYKVRAQLARLPSFLTVKSGSRQRVVVPANHFSWRRVVKGCRLLLTL